MNSFTLTAVGNLARNPEAVAKGDITYTRFCLVGNDYVGKDDEGAPREIVTSLWFVAFGPLGESLVRNTRKGDQLVIEARVRANNWTDKQGEKQYDLDFVVQGFRFGAPGKIKREEREARREAHSNADSMAIHDPGVNAGTDANQRTSGTTDGTGASQRASGTNGSTATDRRASATDDGTPVNQSHSAENVGTADQGAFAADPGGATNQGAPGASVGGTADRSGANDAAGASKGAHGSNANSGEKASRGRRAAAPPP